MDTCWTKWRRNNLGPWYIQPFFFSLPFPAPAFATSPRQTDTHKCAKGHLTMLWPDKEVLLEKSPYCYWSSMFLFWLPYDTKPLRFLLDMCCCYSGAIGKMCLHTVVHSKDSDRPIIRWLYSCTGQIRRRNTNWSDSSLGTFHERYFVAVWLN